MPKINRRNFIKLSSATAALTATPSIIRAQEASSFEARVIVVGGGFAGATAAKYLRLWGQGKIHVTLVDKNPNHVSCVLSNLILNDRLQIDDITLPYTPLEDNYGVIVEQGLVTSVTGSSVKTVELNGGTKTLTCDYVVLAPGIEFIDIPGLKDENGNNFDTIPHAWISGERTNSGQGQTQTELLREQLHAMPNNGNGVFVMTVPQSPYRCPPGPYERACVVADYLKNNKGGGTVYVLDPHADITIERETFKSAFEGLYADIIIYVPNAELIEVKASSRTAITSEGTFSGDVLNVIPTHKAGKIVETLGLTVGNWAPVDVRSYESTISDKSGFYIIGDSNNSGQPKSGHMANAQAKVCADAIIRTIASKSSSTNLVNDANRLANLKTNSACYSPITYDEASWLSAVFAYDTTKNAMTLVSESFGSSNEPHWSNDNFEDMFEWSRSLFSNTFR